MDQLQQGFYPTGQTPVTRNNMEMSFGGSFQINSGMGEQNDTNAICTFNTTRGVGLQRRMGDDYIPQASNLQDHAGLEPDPSAIRGQETAFTNEAAKIEARRRKWRLKGEERRKQQRLAQLRLGIEVDPQEIRSVFNQPLRPISGAGSLGLPMLARRLARRELEAAVPPFQLPRIEFDTILTLDVLMRVAENHIQAPSSQIWVVWQHNLNQKISLPTLLDLLTQNIKGHPDLSQVCLVRRDEFDYQKDRFVNHIGERFTEAYANHYKQQYEVRHKNYTETLETHLKEAFQANQDLQARNKSLKDQRSHLRGKCEVLEGEIRELNRQLQDARQSGFPAVKIHNHVDLREEDFSLDTCVLGHEDPFADFFQADQPPPGNIPRSSLSCDNTPDENSVPVINEPHRQHAKNQETKDADDISAGIDVVQNSVPRGLHFNHPQRNPCFDRPLDMNENFVETIHGNSGFQVPPDADCHHRVDDNVQSPRPNLGITTSLSDQRADFFSPLYNQSPLIGYIQGSSNQNTFLKTEEFRGVASTSTANASAETDRPVSVGQKSLGRIIDEDEIGPIYDYSELAVGLRGGAGSPDDLNSSECASSSSSYRNEQTDRFHAQSMNNAGFNQLLQRLQEEDDEVDYTVPVIFNGVSILGPSSAEVDHKSKIAEALSNAMGSQSSHHNVRKDRFAPAFADVNHPNPNNSFVGIDYFRTLLEQNSLAHSASSTENAPISCHFEDEKEDPDLDPLRMTFTNVSNTAAAAIFTNSTPNSRIYGRDSSALIAAYNSPIESRVLAQTLRNDELHLARKSMTEFERINSEHISKNTGPIIQQIGGDTIIYKPKSDKRLRNTDEDGNYLGGAHNMPKKRQLRGLKEQIRERHIQLLEKSQEYRYYYSLRPEDRAWLWEQRNKPLMFWQGRPGADADDQVEIDQIPQQYVNAYRKHKERHDNQHGSSSHRSTTSIGSFPSARSQIAQSYAGSILDPENEGTEGFENTNALQFDSDPESSVHGYSSYRKTSCNVSTTTGSVASQTILRSDEQILSMLRDIFLTRDRFPAPGSTSSLEYRTCPSIALSSSTWSIASGSPSSKQATGEPDDIFLAGYDGPEIQLPEDVKLAVEEFDIDLMEDYKKTIEANKTDPRAVLVTLHPGPKYTPGALTKRLFGGTIQDIQLHGSERAAVVIFLFASDAAAFITHIRRVKRYGLHQEIVSLQIEAEWYKGSRTEAIVASQVRILQHAMFKEATRIVCLNNLRLDVTRDTIFSELGIRLGKLLASVVLVTPKQRYKQAQEGRQAIIEFVSIKDAIESRNALLQGKIQGYDNCEPVYVADPALASENYQEKDYCRCTMCKECNHDRAVVVDNDR